MEHMKLIDIIPVGRKSCLNVDKYCTESNTVQIASTKNHLHITKVSISCEDKKSRSEHQNEQYAKKKFKFLCEHCGHFFQYQYLYLLHLKRHFGNKDWICEFCEKKFTNPNELTTHLRTHTGERRYACNFCAAKFKNSSTRVSHVRNIHTDERSVHCLQCGKAFRTKYHLKNHILIHDDLREFKCEMCNKQFRRKTHLDKHCTSQAHLQKNNNVQALKLEDKENYEFSN